MITVGPNLDLLQYSHLSRSFKNVGKGNETLLDLVNYRCKLINTRLKLRSSGARIRPRSENYFFSDLQKKYTQITIPSLWKKEYCSIQNKDLFDLNFALNHLNVSLENSKIKISRFVAFNIQFVALNR